jgi:hypothetical protein
MRNANAFFAIVLLLASANVVAKKSEYQFTYGEWVAVNKTPSAFYVNCYGKISGVSASRKYRIENPRCNDETVFQTWWIKEKDLTASHKPL